MFSFFFDPKNAARCNEQKMSWLARCKMDLVMLKKERWYPCLRTKLELALVARKKGIRKEKMHEDDCTVTSSGRRTWNNGLNVFGF